MNFPKVTYNAHKLILNTFPKILFFILIEC